jgi:hypothetical protein
MKLVSEYLYEKFTDNSDPIRDMGIGMKFPENFVPMFRLKKQFPGMDYPIGTIFGKSQGWSCLAALDEKGKEHWNTGWLIEDYFIPYVGEFFEKF